LETAKSSEVHSKQGLLPVRDETLVGQSCFFIERDSELNYPFVMENVDVTRGLTRLFAVRNIASMGSTDERKRR